MSEVCTWCGRPAHSEPCDARITVGAEVYPEPMPRRWAGKGGALTATIACPCARHQYHPPKGLQ